MNRKSKGVSSTNWETSRRKKGKDEDWETLSTGGFAPMWKPTREGEDVIFIPLSAKVMPPIKGQKESATVECELTGGASKSFFVRDVKRGVANGERFVIPLSYNLMGEDLLGVHEKKHARLSKLANFLLSKRISMRIRFDAKIKIKGGRHVKQFTVQVPKGVREQIASKK